MERSQITLAVACNDREVLGRNLFRSPGIESIGKIVVYDAKSAMDVVNQVVAEAKTPFVVLAHQDVVLARKFFDYASLTIERLEAQSKGWGLCASVGLTPAREVIGGLYCTGSGGIIGKSPMRLGEVVTADEVCLLLNRERILPCIDHSHPGFHLFATSLICECRLREIQCFAGGLPVIHNSNPVLALDSMYRSAYHRLRRKYAPYLPIENFISPIDRIGLGLIRARLRIARKRLAGKHGFREADPWPMVDEYSRWLLNHEEGAKNV